MFVANDYKTNFIRANSVVRTWCLYLLCVYFYAKNRAMMRRVAFRQVTTFRASAALVASAYTTGVSTAVAPVCSANSSMRHFASSSKRLVAASSSGTEEGEKKKKGLGYYLPMAAFWLAGFEIWIWFRKKVMEGDGNEVPLATLEGHQGTENDRCRSMFASYHQPEGGAAEAKPAA